MVLVVAGSAKRDQVGRAVASAIRTRADMVDGQYGITLAQRQQFLFIRNHHIPKLTECQPGECDAVT